MSDFESLMMAHDNLQRELADYKSMVSKDKHELIKSNISKIKKIGELEKENKNLHKRLQKNGAKYKRDLDIVHQKNRNRNGRHQKQILEIHSENSRLKIKFSESEEQNKRYREVLHGILDLLNSRDWSKYDASALQDNIDDYITLKNGDLLESDSSE